MIENIKPHVNPGVSEALEVYQQLKNLLAGGRITVTFNKESVTFKWEYYLFDHFVGKETVSLLLLSVCDSLESLAGAMAKTWMEQSDKVNKGS